MQVREAVAGNAARHMHNVEDRIDDAYQAAALFAANLTDLRRDARLAAVVGTEVYSSAVRVSTHLAAARAEAVRMHGELAALKDQFRIRGDLVPPTGDKPPPGSVAGATVDAPAIERAPAS